MAASDVEQKDVVFTLARNIVKVNYEDIPAEAIDATKKSILDTLGVIIGASGVTPALKELVELVKEAGGKEESTILSFGGKVPAWMAAFVNGAMAHCLDYGESSSRGWGTPKRPDRFYDETLPEGPAKGARISRQEVEAYKQEYYQLRGWDNEGRPTKKKIGGAGASLRLPGFTAPFTPFRTEKRRRPLAPFTCALYSCFPLTTIAYSQPN